MKNQFVRVMLRAMWALGATVCGCTHCMLRCRRTAARQCPVTGFNATCAKHGRGIDGASVATTARPTEADYKIGRKT